MNKKEMIDRLLFHHTFTFNKDANGGEQLWLSTDYMNSGDGDGFWTSQTLTLMSYGNSASFNLSDAFMPENLRQLANELEDSLCKARRKWEQFPEV